MNKFANVETGEILKNIYRDKDGVLKAISYNLRNYIIRETETGETELIRFKKDFIVPEHNELDEEVLLTDSDLYEFKAFMHERRFWLDENGIAHPAKHGANISDFFASMKKGSKRAIKNFYDYALTNTWEYFATFTFRDEEIRNNKKMMSFSWQKITAFLKRKFPDFKAIACYEEFEKGGYHIHAILSGCDLTLTPARNNKIELKNGNPNPDYGQFLYSEFGQQIFNCQEWKLGFNTVVCLKTDSNNVQIVNYLGKYMNKCSPAPWSCRRFFKTQNLTARHVVVGLAETEAEFDLLIKRFGLELKKEDGAENSYYRNYGGVQIKKGSK